MAPMQMLVAVMLAVSPRFSEGVFTPCLPDCYQDGVSTAEGSKVADPSDCYRYYVCSDPSGKGRNFVLSEEPLTCPDGTYFNRDSSNGTIDCLPVPDGGVEGVCEPCNPCAVECGSDVKGSHIPDPYDCKGFYFCTINGELDETVIHCDAGQLFDYPSQSCLPEANATCYDACDPCHTYCAGKGRVTNPQDCTKYHYCEPGSVPSIANFTCGAESWFNPLTQGCEEDQGVTCTPTCPN